MAVSAVAVLIAEAFVAALVSQVTEELWEKLEGDPAKRAFQLALGTAIQRYATSGSRFSLAKPLLQEDSPLLHLPVTLELTKLVQFEMEPDVQLIGARWKAAMIDPPDWRDFAAEASLLLKYLEAELRGTTVFRPVFDSQALDAIAYNAEVSTEKLANIAGQLEAISAMMNTSFGVLASAFGGAAGGLRQNIRDDSRLIEEKTRGFVGRQFVFDAFWKFSEDNPRGYFFVRGDPGIGKTALAAQMVRSQGALHHFNVRAEGINRTDIFLKNICSQLIVVHGLDHHFLPPEASQDAGFLNQLLDEVSAGLEPDQKVVIIVDALDEVDESGHSEGQNILFLPVRLPDGIYIIATTRRMPSRLRIECEQVTLDIEQNSDGNIADIREYMTVRVSFPAITDYIDAHGISASQFIELLVEKSQGNFMYLHYVVPEIENGAYKDLKLDAIPTGLQDYYRDHWRRMRGDDEDAWFEYKLPVVMALTVVKEPVSIDLLADFSGVSRRSRIRTVLHNWSQFLYDEEVAYEGGFQKRYRVYHASFHDFIARMEEVTDERVSRQAAHERIAETLWANLFDDE